MGLTKLHVIGIVVGALLLFAAVVIITYMVVSTTSTDDGRCANASVPAILTVWSNDNRILITWFEPWPNQECGATYLLEYTIDDRQPVQVSVKNSSYTINEALEGCSVITARLWAKTASGVINEDFISQSFIEYPTNILFGNITISSNIEGIFAEWFMLGLNDRCVLHYNVEISTELGTSHRNTDTQAISATRDLFCLSFTMNFDAIFNSRNVASATRYYRESTELDIQVAIDPQNPSELIASWRDHPNSAKCSIGYRVYYATNDEMFSVNTTLTKARFMFIPCVQAEVFIHITSPYGITSGNAANATQCPIR